MIKILVYEKHPEKVAFYLSLNDSENDLEFIIPNEIHNFFSKQVDLVGPDIIIVEYDAIFNAGKEEFTHFLEKIRKIKFVCSLQESEIHNTLRVLKFGIKGVFLNTDSKDVLFDCLFKIMKYNGCISPNLVSKFTGFNDELLNIMRSLSFSQKRVIKEMLEGKSDKMIADTLNLSYHTIKTHRKNIFKKFNINSLGQFYSMLS